MVVIRQRPQGGTCAYDKTLVPSLVVYSDGAVLASDDGGYFCDKLPRIWLGWVDPIWTRSRLGSYFSSDQSRVDMTTWVPVADGMTTQLIFTAQNAVPKDVSAYVLDLGRLGIQPPSGQASARAALRAVIADLTRRVDHTTPWLPRSVEVVKPATWVPKYGGSPHPWPAPVSAAVSSVVAGAEGACTILTGKEAAALLKAQQNRTAMSSWLISGHSHPLAVGVVIPGLASCVN